MAGTPLLSQSMWHQIAGVTQGQLLTGIFQDMEHLVNSVGPTNLPTLEELMRLYYTGFFGGSARERTNFNAFAIQHGADFTSARRSTASGRERQVLWGGILSMRQPRYPMSLLRKLWRRAQVGDDQQAIDTERRNLENLMRDSLRYQGFPDSTIQDYYANEAEDVSAGQAVVWYRLGAITRDQCTQYLRALGFTDYDIQRMLLDKFTPPSVGELLGFAAINATNADFVSRWGLDSRKPDWWSTWSDRAGLNYVFDPGSSFGTTPLGEGQGDSSSPQRISLADIVWRSHYRMPSVGEIRQWLLRFRGTKGQPQTYSVPYIDPLTNSELSRLYDALGIPTAMQTYYSALTYDPPGYRHINLLLSQHATNTAEIAGWLADGGLQPETANRFAVAMVTAQQEKDAAPLIKARAAAVQKLITQVESAYEIGTLARPVAIAELTANGVDSSVSAVTLAAIDIRVANTLAKEVIARTRADVFSGVIPLSAAGPRLTVAGLAAPRITQLISTWEVRLHGGRQRMSTANILRYLRRGLLTRDQAIVRLANLGWSAADQLLLLHDVQAEIASDQAKAIASVESGIVREERAILTQIGKMQSLFSRLTTRLKTLTPKADLVKWFKAGIWSEDKVRDRLALLGYTPDVIDAIIADASSGTKQPAATKGGGS